MSRIYKCPLGNEGPCNETISFGSLLATVLSKLNRWRSRLDATAVILGVTNVTKLAVLKD